MIAADDLESRARRVVARLSDSERSELAVAAYTLLLAEEMSMTDLAYRASIRELISAAAPSLAKALMRTLTTTRRVRYGLSPETRTS